ncbi:MAG: hypothetical protein ACR2PM_16080, partial [Hyphomicrobiales bacterium]
MVAVYQAPVSAEDIKAKAKALGFDLVGIADGKAMDANPPDPASPRRPSDISDYDADRVIVLAKRHNLGSTRHLGIEAGLGTFGLEVNILTPEFGPRVYLTGILTDLELEPDEIMTEQVCIGESCSRCLYSCPTDAVKHFGIDKRNCAKEAQEFGFMTSLPTWERFIDGDAATKKELFKSRDIYGFWQGLLRVVGSFGDCPRCLAVCPVGNDYHAYLADDQKKIPEKTPEKVINANAFKQARKDGDDVSGLNEWNVRWVG